METFSTRYRALVEVRVFHEYYADRTGEWLRIVPDKSTRQVLANHGLVFRRSPSGFLVTVQTASDNRPMKLLDDMELVFELTYVHAEAAQKADLPKTKQGAEATLYVMGNDLAFVAALTPPALLETPADNLQLIENIRFTPEIEMEKITDRALLGKIRISGKQGLGDYGLLKPNGEIRTERQPNGNWNIPTFTVKVNVPAN
ncbi:hypothetical protein [Runella sp.]|uniref:hypothetical protein n=1 Tax=Runella sp. TaxID=1960881 RepID=UPI003D117720